MVYGGYGEKWELDLVYSNNRFLFALVVIGTTLHRWDGEWVNLYPSQPGISIFIWKMMKND